ncbi:MAG: LuxR C-terminal-related transcriptional regulator [Ornithinibacter sp.]
MADELFVSRHTVKTQAMSAYRKLGVHTRAEAIVTARRAGLLPQR